MNPDDDDIIENRNIFVPDFHIKQYKSNMPRELTDLLRIKHSKHKEYYVNEKSLFGQMDRT